jgi:ribonuclease-3
MGIEKYIVSQANVQHNGKYFYGDVLEALIGAIFLDKGLKKTEKIVLRHIIKEYIDPSKLLNNEKDFKSRVIEWCQKHKQEIVFKCRIETNACESNNHPNYFYADLLINNKIVAQGEGLSKKEAEQNAARMIWEKQISRN